MHNETIRLMDAIPASSEHYDRRVEQALAKAISGRRTVSLATVGTRRVRIRRSVFVAMLAAVLLLAASTAFAAVLVVRQNYTPREYLAAAPEQRHAEGQTIPEVESVIASAQPASEGYTITMLPDMPDAEKLNAFRQEAGQPAYAETDWGWVRELHPSVQEVLWADGIFSFTLRLETPHADAFGRDSTQRVSAASEGLSFSTDGVNWTPIEGFGEEDSSVGGENAVTLFCTYENLQTPLPETGIVLIRDEIAINDCKVDDLAHAGQIALLTYTFTFHAGAPGAQSDVTVTQRALSGSAVLTVERNLCQYENIPVQLDGVILEETTEFRATGVYVSYRLLSAPDTWTDEMRAALLSPSFEKTEFMGLSVLYVADRSDPNAVPVRVEHTDAEKGTVTVILPIFPSDYARIRQTGYGLELGLRCLDKLNGITVGAPWQGSPNHPEDGWDTLSREQPLLSVTLPTPA